MKFGLRIIKTGLAVSLCVLVAKLLHLEYPFYSAIAAVIAMQATIADSLKQGLHRMQGTIVGAIIGFLFALIMVGNPWWTGLGLIITLAILKLMHWNEAMNIASIVFIAIMVNITGRPMNYAINRIIDTAIGITIAFLVNRFVFPPRYKKEVEESFQDARFKVIDLYKRACRSLVNAQTIILSDEISNLKDSLVKARFYVERKRKEDLWGQIDLDFRQLYIGPLCRLDKMFLTINELINLKLIWQHDLSAILETDLIEIFAHSSLLVTLITTPSVETWSEMYLETENIINRIRTKAQSDPSGTYCGQNREAVLELLFWIEQMIGATGGCLGIKKV